MIQNGKPASASGHGDNMSLSEDGTKLIKKTTEFELAFIKNRQNYPELEEIIPKIFELNEEKKTITMEYLLKDIKEPLILDLKFGKWIVNSKDSSNNKLTDKIGYILEHDPEYLTEEEKSTKKATKLRKFSWRQNLEFYKKLFYCRWL